MEHDGYVILYSYDGLGNRVEQLATKTYTLWESEAKQVREKMRKLQDKLAFLDENDYCIAYFYGEAEELMKLENTYSYYYRNRLIEEERITYPTEATYISYLNDITQEYTEVISEVQDGLVTNYYYGNRRISSDERIYVYDGLGNVIQDISKDGGLLESYSYSAYGERNIQYNPFLRNSSYGYRGEAHTYDNKQYLRARYYDVHSEIFIQEDSYKGELDEPLSRNRYAYVLNNPYKYSDPSGHAEQHMLDSTGKSSSLFTWLHLPGPSATGFKLVKYLLYNGSKHTGLYPADGKFYKNGLLRNEITDKGKWVNGVFYANAVPNPPEPGPSPGSSFINQTQEYNDFNNNPPAQLVRPAYVVPKIHPFSPTVDVSALNKAAQEKVAETATVLGISEKMLSQVLYVDLYLKGLFPNGSLSDRVKAACDYYLGKTNSTDGSTDSIKDSKIKAIVDSLPNKWRNDVDSKDGNKVVLGGMAHYNQTDDAVKEEPLYNDNGVATNKIQTGCQFVSFVTVYSRYAGYEPDLLAVRDWLKRERVRTSSWHNEADLAKATGMQTRELYDNTGVALELSQAKQIIKACIDKGHPVITRVYKKEDGGSHFCVAYGYDGEDVLVDTVAHPKLYDKEEKPYKLSRYVDQSGGKIIGLWVFWS